MKSLNEERIRALSTKIWKALKNEGVVTYSEPEKALISLKKTMQNFFNHISSLDKSVREKISSLKRNIPEGSREWDILYRQYFEESLKKQGL